MDQFTGSNPSFFGFQLPSPLAIHLQYPTNGVRRRTNSQQSDGTHPADQARSRNPYRSWYDDDGTHKIVFEDGQNSINAQLFDNVPESFHNVLDSLLADALHQQNVLVPTGIDFNSFSKRFMTSMATKLTLLQNPWTQGVPSGRMSCGSMGKQVSLRW
jgi:hypothetical protein